MAESRQNLHEATVTTDAVDYLPGWTGTTTTEASRVGPVSLAKTVAAGADSLTAIDPEDGLKVLGVQDDGTPVGVNVDPAAIAAAANAGNGAFTPVAVTGDAIDAAIDLAIAAGSGRVYVPPGAYSISTRYAYTLSGSLVLEFADGAVITSTATDPVGEDGLFRFTGSGSTAKIEIHGYSASASASATGTLSAIEVINVADVEIANADVSGWSKAGIKVIGADRLVIRGSRANSNKYAGILFAHCQDVSITNNEASTNGHVATAPADGYGIAGSTQYTSISGYRSNQRVSITGNVCVNNVRKGIDLHDGIDVVIAANLVDGYGNAGIYAVHETSEQVVENVVISNNIVRQNSSFLSGLSIGSYQQMSAINVGNSGNESGSEPTKVGAFTISGNVVDGASNAVSTGGDGFGVLVNTDDSASVLSLTLQGNSIKDAGTVSGISVIGDGLVLSTVVQGNTVWSSGSYSGAAIDLSSGRSVAVDGNRISATSTYGISAINAIGGVISNNVLSGTFSTDSIGGNIYVLIESNRINGVAVPAVEPIKEYVASTKLAGGGRVSARTGGSAGSSNIVTVNPSSDESVAVYVRVVQSRFGANGKAMYHGVAYADATTRTGATLTGVFTPQAGTTAPVLSWSGSGPWTLAISWPDTYSGYVGTFEFGSFDETVTFA